MVSLPPQLQTLLEAAQSEAKRLGDEWPSKSHLAVALLRRYPDRTRECWGDLTESTLISHGARDESGKPEGSLSEFLRGLTPSGDLVGTLCRALAADLNLSGGDSSQTAESETRPDRDGQAQRATARNPAAAEPEAGKSPLAADETTRALRTAVVGQDEAVERVVRRLALTRSDLDLKPNRPDGVFLLAGPTGVGKTAFAKALAQAVFPDGQGFIRIDMSEYQDDQMAIAKLIGSGPGYVGYNEPDAWLTTRVLKAPNAVVLLDEIEKASRSVWTLFLQVFDEGRLTDGRGKTANFADTIIVMTSNIGARQYFDRSVGFAESRVQSEKIGRSVVSEIRSVMPPELFNRIDEIIVFRQLNEDNIREIARREIQRAQASLAGRGYVLDIADEAIDLVARTGYDPDLGARHLLRNIERMLLEPLVTKGPGSYRVGAVGDELSWEVQ